MIRWFAPALVAALLWAGVNVADDQLLRNVYREPRVATGMAGCAAVFPAVAVFAWHGSIALNRTAVLLSMLAGLGTTLYVYLLFLAFARHEPSIVVALGGLGQIALPVGAAIVVAERLSVEQYVGIVIIAVGTSCLALLDRRSSAVSARLVLLASVGAALFVGSSLCLKHAYQLRSFPDVFPWYGVGSVVAGIGFLASVGRARLAVAADGIGRRLLLLIAGIEAVNGAADYLQGWAISRGPVSAVRAVEGTQPLFVLGIGVVLARISGHVSRERGTNLWAKVGLFGALVVGVILVA
ncbi:MAG TPA: DMT family transporter [Mycobacteriales bacterium]|nr:DMT family transporter [Mycobacteriales bacterium]